MLVSWLQNKNCFSASAFGDRWQRVGWKEEEELHLGIYFGEIGSFTFANVSAHCAQLSLFLLFSALLHMIIFSFLSFSLSSSFIPWNQTDRAIGEERELFIFLLPDSKSLEGLSECAPSTKSHPEGGKKPPKTGSKYDIRELRLLLQYTVRLSSSGGFLCPGVCFCQTEVSDDCFYALVV